MENIEDEVYKKLKKCIKKCDILGVKSIINLYPNLVNKKDKYGNTLLMKNYEKYCKYFHKIDRKFNNDNQIDGRIEIMEFLLEKGADINARDESENTLMLTLCSDFLPYIDVPQYERLKKFIRVILKYNVDLNVKDEEDDTALKYILSHFLYFDMNNASLQEIIEIFLESKIDKIESIILYELFGYIENCYYKNEFEIIIGLIKKVLNNKNIGKLEYRYDDINAEIEIGWKNLDTELVNHIRNPRAFEFILDYNHNIEKRKLEKEIEKLKRENEELRYQPGNPGYLIAKGDFYSLSEKIKKNE